MPNMPNKLEVQHTCTMRKLKEVFKQKKKKNTNRNLDVIRSTKLVAMKINILYSLKSLQNIIV